MKKIKIIEIKKFSRELKKLKNYHGLKNDLDILKETISQIPEGNGTEHWNCLKEDLEKELFIFKVRLYCKSTKGANFRVIYFYDGKTIELIFIEIYFKGQKVNEDKKRIDDFWKNVNKN